MKFWSLSTTEDRKEDRASGEDRQRHSALISVLKVGLRQTHWPPKRTTWQGSVLKSSEREDARLFEM